MDAAPINPLVQQSLNMQGGQTYGANYGTTPQPQGTYVRPLHGLGNYTQPGQYPFSGQLPPRFGQFQQPPVGRMSSGFGGGGGNLRSAGPWGQPQQMSQSQFPFQLPNMLGLGDFYTPHGMGDAQNVPNQGAMANFIGNQWQSNQWGQTPSNSGQPNFNLPRGGYQPPIRGY